MGTGNELPINYARNYWYVKSYKLDGDPKFLCYVGHNDSVGNLNEFRIQFIPFFSPTGTLQVLWGSENSGPVFTQNSARHDKCPGFIHVIKNTTFLALRTNTVFHF